MTKGDEERTHLPAEPAPANVNLIDEDGDVVATSKPKADTTGQGAMLTMILTMADTTWRMFVPILGLLLLGIYGDKKLGVFPLMTLIGFALGVLISAWLIRTQLRKKA